MSINNPKSGCRRNSSSIGYGQRSQSYFRMSLWRDTTAWMMLGAIKKKSIFFFPKQRLATEIQGSWDSSEDTSPRVIFPLEEGRRLLRLGKWKTSKTWEVVLTYKAKGVPKVTQAVMVAEERGLLAELPACCSGNSRCVRLISLHLC